MYILFPKAAIPVGSASSSTIPRAFGLAGSEISTKPTTPKSLSVYIKVFPSSEVVTTSEDVLVVDFAPSGKFSLTLKEEILLKFFSFVQYFVFQLVNPLFVDEATIASNNEFNGGDALHLHKEPHHVSDGGEGGEAEPVDND